MQTLYEIAKNYQDLFDSLEPESENIETILEQIEITEQDFNEKALGYCKYIKSLETDIEAIDSEISRLQVLKKSKSNKKDFLKERLKTAMCAFGKEKLDLNLFKLAIRTSESVQVKDISSLPSQFVSVKVEADKRAIKDYLKLGNNLEGCEIIKNNSLNIR